MGFKRCTCHGLGRSRAAMLSNDRLHTATIVWLCCYDCEANHARRTTKCVVATRNKNKKRNRIRRNVIMGCVYVFSRQSIALLEVIGHQLAQVGSCFSRLRGTVPAPTVCHARFRMSSITKPALRYFSMLVASADHAADSLPYFPAPNAYTRMNRPIKVTYQFQKRS